MLTFGKVSKLGVGRKAHVLFSRETVTVKSLRPWVTLAGKHWGTAVSDCHTQTTAGLDKTEGKKDKTSNNERRTNVIMMKTGFQTESGRFMYFRSNGKKRTNVKSPYVSRQTGAMREQRKAWA